MTAKEEMQAHLEDIQAHIGELMIHELTLKREIELLEPKVISKIVKPKTINIHNIRKEDLEFDLTPIRLADMQMVQNRKQLYYAKIELAQTKVEIQSKINYRNTLIEHIQQELQKEARPLSDQMIFDAFRRCQDLKDKSPDEQSAIKEISANLLNLINSDKTKRIALYETLTNILKQHE